MNEHLHLVLQEQTVNGFSQTEDITGPNATTVSSAKGYKTITNVVADAVFVGAISMGILMTDKISWAKIFI